MNLTRRSVLAGIGAGTAGALAGCLGGDNPDVDGYTAFFSLYDWANEVGGDELSFEDPVGTGRMGHGWSPDGSMTTDVASTDIFVYLDTTEFSWAQDLAGELRADYDDMTVIDALDGLDPYFIAFDEDGEEDGDEGIPAPDYDTEFEPEDLGLDDFDIWDLREDQQLGYWHNDHWHGGIPDIPLDSFVPVAITIEDTDERVVPLGDEHRFRVDARLTDDSDEEAVRIESQGDHVEFHGETEGEAEIIFEIYDGDELIYDTEDDPDAVTVTEDAADFEFFDPHLWVDPIHAQRMVDNITEGLVSYDPDNEDTYRENAEAYKEQMDDVHDQIEEVVSEAELGVAVFAGHDSYQYLERRYNFQLVTPVGVTPDAAESFDDISNLAEVIEEHDIDTVLYDPFEAANPGEDYPQMVDLLFDETDIEEAEPLSPVEGVTEEWADNDWGWVDQMENVNIPSLKKALKAD